MKGASIGSSNKGLNKNLSYQTIVNINKEGLATGNTIYVVPANKTFYCTSMFITGTTFPYMQVYVYDGTNKLLSLYMANNNVKISSRGSYLDSNNIIFKVTAGTTLTIVFAGGGGIWTTMSGWLE